MYIFMEVPLMVATATSNFMIGVTAAASSMVYYRRGDILVQAAAPLAVASLSDRCWERAWLLAYTPRLWCICWSASCFTLPVTWQFIC